jgi:hypothetical protein
LGAAHCPNVKIKKELQIPLQTSLHMAVVQAFDAQFLSCETSTPTSYFCLNCLQQYHKECQLQTCYLVTVLTQLLLEQQYASIVWRALKVPN